MNMKKVSNQIIQLILTMMLSIVTISYGGEYQGNLEHSQETQTDTFNSSDDYYIASDGTTKPKLPTSPILSSGGGSDFFTNDAGFYSICSPYFNTSTDHKLFGVDLAIQVFAPKPPTKLQNFKEMAEKINNFTMDDSYAATFIHPINFPTTTYEAKIMHKPIKLKTISKSITIALAAVTFSVVSPSYANNLNKASTPTHNIDSDREGFQTDQQIMQHSQYFQQQLALKTKVPNLYRVLQDFKTQRFQQQHMDLMREILSELKAFNHNPSANKPAQQTEKTAIEEQRDGLIKKFSHLVIDINQKQAELFNLVAAINQTYDNSEEQQADSLKRLADNRMILAIEHTDKVSAEAWGVTPLQQQLKYAT